MEKIRMVEVNGADLAGGVAELAGRIWREHYTPIIGQEQVAYMLAAFQSGPAVLKQISQGYLYFLVKDVRDNWVGYIAFEIREKELFLSKFYITAESRGQGYGREAMEFIMGLAKMKALAKIALMVNKKNASSIAVYKKLGFVIKGELRQDIGGGFVMDDYFMEKLL